MAKTENSPSTTSTSTDKQLSSQTIIDLHDRLNTLWITYLEHLDAYVAAQKLIQQHTSAGFMQLARANFNAGRGVRRYGRDYYSERASASRRVEVLVDGEQGCLATRLVSWDGEENPDQADYQLTRPSNGSKGIDEAAANREDMPQQPSPPPKENQDLNIHLEGTPQDSSNDDSASVKPETATPEVARSKTSLDPLRWFGILVPPELRRAQALFTASVEGAIPDGIDSARRMREIEVEIRKLRKEIRKIDKLTKV